MKNDNQGAIALINNPVKHRKSKHIDVRYHFARECNQDNNIVLEYVPSSNNFADMFTKPPKRRRRILKIFEQYSGAVHMGAGTGRLAGRDVTRDPGMYIYVSIIFIAFCLHETGTFFVPSRLGGPIYMIPARRDGTFLSRIDEKLAKAGWRNHINRPRDPGSCGTIFVI